VGGGRGGGVWKKRRGPEKSRGLGKGTATEMKGEKEERRIERKGARKKWAKGDGGA
jgi:hypothetical protein